MSVVECPFILKYRERAGPRAAAYGSFNEVFGGFGQFAMGFVA